MSKNAVKVSPKGQGEAAPVSVFDFLYHDSRRVGSFLAQLDQNGLLREVRQSEHATKGGKRGFSASLGASTPITGGGNLGIEITPKESGGETMERVYDPFWANARELLDALTANNMIRRDVTAAPLGSMVLVTGTLNIIDLGMLKEAWSVDEIKRTALAGGTIEQVGQQLSNRAERRSQGSKSRHNPADPPTESELTIAFLKLLPHSLTALLHGSEGSMWCNLKEEHLVGAGSDLVLKHGHTVPGDWALLGLLDATPDLDALTGTLGLDDDILDGPGAALFNSVIGNISRKLAPIVRLLLGRPSNAYGITPLLIFRQVGG